MDRFVFVLGIIGLVLLSIAIVTIIHSIIGLIKRRKKFKEFITTIIFFLVLCGFGLAFTSIALFLHTFSRFVHEEEIGYVFAEENNDTINMTFYNEKTGRSHFFKLTGDQWMIEGYIMRWSTSLRWLGAGSYFCVTRFTGRDLLYTDRSSIYQIAPENSFWRFLLQHGGKIPFVDGAYGIGAFQYPSADTFHITIDNTGFIIKQ